MRDIYSEILKTSSIFTEVNLCDLPVMLTGDHDAEDSKELPDIILYCVLHGGVSIVFNKNSVETLGAGDVAFIKKNNGDKLAIFENDKAIVMKAVLVPKGIYHDIITCCDDGSRLRILNEKHKEISLCVVALSQLLLSLRSNAINRSGLLESTIALFFVQLYINREQDISLPFHGGDHPISRLMVRILKNPEYQWKVKKLAQEHHMSLNGFINEFRKFSGLTPMSFVQQTRLKKGIIKLENTDMPVSLIARECGYNSHASFTFYMRKMFGKTPLQIRGHARKNKKKHF
ncbi:TPA: helix-turn-helix domain-containing protein [Salmonella enterica subsp. enterica serovar Newport]|nr:helix-turn-helix transcriptional regulator [Salmonella enterica subsp. enterica serovar Newport]EMD2586632.1 helix-turn-helix transcriptional regulator [Salmonella enterica]